MSSLAIQFMSPVDLSTIIWIQDLPSTVWVQDPLEPNHRKADFYLSVPEHSYVHINRLLEFLKDKDPTQPIQWKGKCRFSTANLSTFACITSTLSSISVISVDEFCGCNYLGYTLTSIEEGVTKYDNYHPETKKCCYVFHPYGGEEIPRLKKLIICEQMTREASHSLHAYFGYKFDSRKFIDSVDNWTLVVAYYNLTTRSDSNSEVRTFSHYISHSRNTLSLNQNMIIFCDSDSYSDIYRIRSEYGLLDKTVFKVIPLDDYPLSIYYEKIRKTRAEKNYNFDPRNNPSYLILMAAKYTAMKLAILLNPFNSTHFAWVNICMSRMGLRNIEYLNRSLRINRDKFSTCYIDYLPPQLVKNKREYYSRGGRCTMCSGFFTGSKLYMYQVCGLFEQKFIETVEEGYGHADEQLYSAVYFDHPELFSFYYGDYYQMITNYGGVYEFPESIFNIFISNALKYQNLGLAKEALNSLWTSYRKGYLQLAPTFILNIYKKYNKLLAELDLNAQKQLELEMSDLYRNIKVIKELIDSDTSMEFPFKE